MTMTRSSPEVQVMAEINITPFTDVLLVLLIIFMILAAIATPPGFQKQVARPSSARTPAPLLRRPIVVEVTAQDRIALDGASVPFDRLYQAMASAIARHGQRHESLHIALVADADASYNAIIKVLDAARQAGDEDVGFVIQ